MFREGGEPTAVGGGVTVNRGFSSMIDESVDEEAEEDNSLASNSSDSFAESSMDSSRVEIEDVTDEDCAERRFQVRFYL